MKLKSLILTTCAAAALAATSAFADLKSEIVGKWTDADGTENIEYKADGTFTETVGGEEMKGKYSFPDTTHIKAELEGPMAAMGAIVSSIKISGDTMDMAGEEGRPALKYTRVKAK
ncbi:MAG: lipocalin-like domain-containing protein [Chthoniobacterales bacterium]